MNEFVPFNYELDLSPNSVWIKAIPTPSTKDRFVYLQECGEFYSNSRHFTRRKGGLQSYLLEYTLAGEGVLEYEGQVYSLKAGDFFWIDCVQPQYYYTNPKVGSWHTIWAHFYGGNSEYYYEQFVALNNGKHKATLDNSVSINSLIQELIRIYDNNEVNTADIIFSSGILTMIMAECINALNNKKLSEQMPQCIKDAIHYISENHTENITLELLAKRYSINKYHFQKLFKRYTNYTPNQFLIMTRLNAAKELLRTTSKNISEISYEVGIQSVNHFINLFKRQEGLTPQTFRNMWYNNQG
ncbi:MAG TPA: AraC family transcriptional regulator [Clostridiales bacterium]|nr:AraC family transcriptional regulator [Clostridiales bacterium]